MVITLQPSYINYGRTLHDLRMLLFDRAHARARLEAAGLADLPTLLQQACGYEMPKGFLASYGEAVAAQDWATVRGVLANVAYTLRASARKRSQRDRSRLGMAEVLSAICGDCAAACGVADMLAQCQRKA